MVTVNLTRDDHDFHSPGLAGENLKAAPPARRAHRPSYGPDHDPRAGFSAGLGPRAAGPGRGEPAAIMAVRVTSQHWHHDGTVTNHVDVLLVLPT